VPVVAEGALHTGKQAALFYEYMILAVDQDVGNIGIAQQRFQRTQAEDFVQQVGGDLLLLVKAQRDPLLGNDLIDDTGHSCARLCEIDLRQLLQIHLGDQDLVDFGFKISIFVSSTRTIPAISFCWQTS